jgi:hypothetical protein
MTEDELKDFMKNRWKTLIYLYKNFEYIYYLNKINYKI